MIREVSGTGLAALGLAVGLAASGCNSSIVGPSLLDVTVSAPVTVPSGTNRALCCCRVTGTAVNNNAVPVHVTLKYKAFDGLREDPLATVIYFIKDLQPGATHAIDASGVLYPCNEVQSVQMEVNVRGITFPPL
jgi:hypothetical protein